MASSNRCLNCRWSRKNSRNWVCANCCSCQYEKCDICQDVHSRFHRSNKGSRKVPCGCRPCQMHRIILQRSAENAANEIAHAMPAQSRLGANDQSSRGIVAEIVENQIDTVLSNSGAIDISAQASVLCKNCLYTRKSRRRRACSECCSCANTHAWFTCDICSDIHIRFHKGTKIYRSTDGCGCTPCNSFSPILKRLKSSEGDLGS